MAPAERSITAWTAGCGAMVTLKLSGEFSLSHGDLVESTRAVRQSFTGTVFELEMRLRAFIEICTV